MYRNNKSVPEIKRKIIKTSKDGVHIILRQIDVVHNVVCGTTTIYIEYITKEKIKRFPLKLGFNLTQEELMYLVFEGEERDI